MEKLKILSEENRPGDFPAHCEFELLSALQVRSFHVQYPILDKKNNRLSQTVFAPIFDSATEAYAYFKNKETPLNFEGWPKNRSRLKADLGGNFFEAWKDFWRFSDT